MAKYTLDSIPGVKVYSLAEFDNLIFTDNTEFSNAIFLEKTSFRHCEFDIFTTFVNTKFEKEVFFSGSKFHSTVNFYNVIFKDNGNFFGTIFVDNANFSGARFEALAYFFDSDFQAESNFRNTEFLGHANFFGVKFGGTSDFSSVTFNEKTNFGKATFIGSTTFDASSFLGPVYLKDSEWPDTINFRDVLTIATRIDLMSISKDPSKTHWINIANSNLSNVNIKFDNLGIIYRLNFPNDISYDDKSGVYESILAKLDNDGFHRSYQIIDISYLQHLYDSRESKFWSFVGWLDRIWWNYGYDKQWIIRNSLILFVLFWAMNGLLFFSLNREVYLIENVRALYPDQSETRNKWPILGSFYYTVIIFFGVAINLEKVKYTNAFLSTYFFIQYVLGLICLVYFLNYFINI